MTIQFNLPQHQVKEWVITYVMNKLMTFHQLDKSIMRMEVNLKDEPSGEKHCDINVLIPGDSLYVAKNSNSFEEASLYALNAIEKRFMKSNQEEFSVMRKLPGWRIKKFA